MCPLWVLQLERAIEIYGGMVEGGVMPSKEVYTSLVHACSKDGDVAKALAIYADMRAAGIMPDEVRIAQPLFSNSRISPENPVLGITEWLR